MGTGILTAEPVEIAASSPSVASRAGWSWTLRCAAVVMAVVAVILLGDIRVHSGSDAGGKAATVAEMADVGFDGTDLGYWAEAADPDGELHPFYNTNRTSEGWIQVTSTAQPLAASVGQRLAGDLGARWVAVLAVPLGALAAAAFVQQVAGSRGVLTFWAVGLASPLTFYGTDQWEHAPALAAALWTLALLVGAPSARRILVAAVLAGVAVALRRELAFVLMAFGAVEAFDRDRRALWLRQWPALAAGAVIGVVHLAFLQAVDGALIGSTTAGRSAAQAGRLGTELGQRFDDAVLTTVSLYGALDITDLVISAALVVGMIVIGRALRRDDAEELRLGVGISVVAVAARIVVGFGFVPGALAAMPVAMLAPTLADGRRRRLVIAAAGAALAVVAFQWTGGLAAQWGGRYLLGPAALWTMIALAELERRSLDRRALAGALASTVLVAGFGLAWHIDRTVGVGESRDAVLEAARGDTVISTHTHFAREIALDLDAEQWLLADRLEEIDQAFAVAAQMGEEQLWLLHPGSCAEPCDRRWDERADAADPAGWSAGEIREIPWLDGTYVLESFARSTVAN